LKHGPVLSKPLSVPSERNLVVPHAEGKMRVQSLNPLYPALADVLMSDQEFYELVTLIDALRIGGPREIKLASHELSKRFKLGAA